MYILVNGKIRRSGGKELALKVEASGYAESMMQPDLRDLVALRAYRRQLLHAGRKLAGPGQKRKHGGSPGCPR